MAAMHRFASCFLLVTIHGINLVAATEECPRLSESVAASVLQTGEAFRKSSHQVVEATDDAVIPRRILQTYKGPLASLPEGMLANVKLWKDTNPEYRYLYFDDDLVQQYIVNRGHHFPGLVESFSRVTSGAVKADMWRALALWAEGGVYADIDMVPRIPLQEFLQDDDQLVVNQAFNQTGRLTNMFMASAPGSPVLARLLNLTIEAVLRRNLSSAADAVDIAGPHQLTNAASQVLFPAKNSVTLQGMAWWHHEFAPGTHSDEARRVKVRVLDTLKCRNDYFWDCKYRGYKEDVSRAGGEIWQEVK